MTVWLAPMERPLKLERWRPADFACSKCGKTMTAWEDFEEYQHAECGGIVELKSKAAVP